MATRMCCRGGIVSWSWPLIALFVLGCGTEGKSIKGRLDREVTARRLPGAHAIDVSQVDHVWALPVYGAGLQSFSLENRIELPLQDDGSFLFEIPEGNGDYDYILALVDSSRCTTATPRGAWTESELDERLGCIQGYVSVADAAGGDAMMAMPTSTQDGEVDVGRLRGDGFEARSADTSLEELSGSYSVGLEGLRSLARVDDMLLGISYLFANQDDARALYYHQNLDYGWRASGGLDTARNRVTDPSDLQFIASTYYFNTNVDTSTIVASLQAADGYLAVTPPGEILLDRDGELHGPDNPIESTAPGMEQDGGWYDELIGFTVNGDFLFGSLGSFEGISPVGDWTIARDGVVVAKADLSVAAPFASIDGVPDAMAPVVYVPSLRVNTDGDTLVDIEVTFSQWNGSAFVEAPFDIAMRTLGATDIRLTTDGSAACPAEAPFGQAGTGDGAVNIEEDRLRWAPEGAWTYGAGDASSCGLAGVTVGLQISANSLQFHWMAQ